MTQSDKNPFADLETSTTATKSPGKQELDFSFFDDPSGQTPQQNTAPDNDFSFFDEPVLAPHTVAPEKPSDTGFSFDDDTAETKEIDAQSETAPGEPNQPLAKPDKHRMVFTCLKCSATEQIDLPEYGEHNLKITCSSCSSAICITVESNAKRATQKSREIYCSNCGHTLDQHPHCPSCGKFCPDYYMVENPAEAARKARTTRSNNFKQMLANLRSSLTWSPGVRAESSKTPQFSTASSKSGKSFALGSKQIRLLAGAAAVVLCLGVAVFFYLKLQNEQRYVENYVKATYAIHVDTDLILNALNKSASDWKSARASGSTYTPRTDTDMETRASKIRSELAKLMQQLQHKVPGKFDQANSKLLALQNELDLLQKATAAPPASLDQLTALIDSSDTRIKQKRQDLKAGLNEELQKEMEIAKKKFRGFEGF